MEEELENLSLLGYLFLILGLWEEGSLMMTFEELNHGSVESLDALINRSL